MVCSVPGAGDEMVAGDSVGIMPQGPGQQPMGPAQLAALLRCVETQDAWSTHACDVSMHLYGKQERCLFGTSNISHTSQRGA
jgi:hypothetical protein